MACVPGINCQLLEASADEAGARLMPRPNDVALSLFLFLASRFQTLISVWLEETTIMMLHSYCVERAGPLLLLSLFHGRTRTAYLYTVVSGGV